MSPARHIVKGRSSEDPPKAGSKHPQGTARDCLARSEQVPTRSFERDSEDSEGKPSPV
jgi:hypothetical protein